MIARNRALLAGVALSALLSACSNSDNATNGGSALPPPVAAPGPTPTPTPLPNQIGGLFLQLFSASADVEATDPPANAVPALDVGNEPLTG